MNCPRCSTEMVKGEFSIRRPYARALFGRWACEILWFAPDGLGGANRGRTVLEARRGRPGHACPSCGTTVIEG